MEEQIQENLHPTQPTQPALAESKIKFSFKRIIILLVVILLLAGGIYAGIQIVKGKIGGQGCSSEAKICPDGSSVGRIGPNCEFAPCPNPSSDEKVGWKSYKDERFKIEFWYPSEWQIVASQAGIVSFKDSTAGPGLSSLPDISVKHLALGSSQDFKQALISDAVYDGSGEHPKSFAEFQTINLGENQVYRIQTGLFEGILSLNYYLVKDEDVIAFYLISSPVDWTNPDYKPENDPLDLKLKEAISTFGFLGDFSEKITALSVYQGKSLSQPQLDRELLANVFWPKLRPFKDGDLTREVYLVDCRVTATGMDLAGLVEEVPNAENILEITLDRMVEKHLGGFPDAEEIAAYEQASQGAVDFKNADSGINGLFLADDGTLTVNFYDSVQTYGGGSTRVGCLSLATLLTALQFPAVEAVTMCVDKYENCFMDFQP